MNESSALDKMSQNGGKWTNSTATQKAKSAGYIQHENRKNSIQDSLGNGIVGSDIEIEKIEESI